VPAPVAGGGGAVFSCGDDPKLKNSIADGDCTAVISGSSIVKSVTISLREKMNGAPPLPHATISLSRTPASHTSILGHRKIVRCHLAGHDL